LCGGTAYTLSGNTPSVGTGAWTIPYNTSGVAPSFSSTTNPTANVTNLSAGNTYTFQWRTTNGACSSTSNDTLRILQLPSTATTDGDQTLSGASTATVHGNTPTTGTGLWSQTAGPAVTINSPSNPTTTVSGLMPGDAYDIRWTISNGVCTPSYSALTLTNNAISLPLRILSFSGKWNDGAPGLSWQTADEKGCDYFELLRSTDGIAFRPVGRVKAKGGAGGNHYQYTDNEVSGFSETLYYRLRETDLGGQSFYSNTITLRRTTSQAIQVQPNPFTGSLSIDLNVDAAGSADALLYDMTGRVAYQANQSLSAGSNHIQLNDLSALPAGIYTLCLWQDGTLLLRYRVTK
jgi:hypothetical protein